MRLLKTLAAAAVLSTAALTAHAGGLAPVVQEQPVVIVDTPEPAGSSVNAGFIVLGLLAALVAASASF